MTCSACAASVEKAVKRLPGIRQAVVDVLNNRAQVLFYPSFVNVSFFFTNPFHTHLQSSCLFLFMFSLKMNR
uniref:Copper-transporting ATPase 3 n=1 Tax=Cajanus cajan TaxID=3821 RepID=A0A151T5M2_CAJCA|nr:Putative copper-transporting ATPase 3 [Cajanus cajan]